LVNCGRNLPLSGRGRGRHPYRRAKPKRKRVIVSGPIIVHMLKEDDIFKDWIDIQKLVLEKEDDNLDQH